MVNFKNKYIEKIYKYIYINDDQTLLVKDMVNSIGLSAPTIRKYIRWLVDRNLIQKKGKHFKIMPA